MKIKFIKMHGIGNDFVLIDARNLKINNWATRAKGICDRKFGVGADQLLIIENSEKADFKMLIFNADGGEVEMCGNGIRCFAKYLVTHNLTEKKELAVETLTGIIRPKVLDNLVEVNMGEPQLEGENIPVNINGKIISYPITIKKNGRDLAFDITCVSMGNPHCVIFVDDVDNFPVNEYGPMLESHDFFPNRINVEFVEVVNKNEIKMRVWERGSGETLACGTGACASAVASVLNNLVNRNITVHLAGGDLEINWDNNNIVQMTGPAEEVFEGIMVLNA